MVPTAKSPLARCRAARGAVAFTLVEVMVSVCVLVLVIASSLIVLQTGMRAVDTARNMTLASQITQSAIEVLRLQNWTQITALPGSATLDIEETISSGTGTALDVALNRVAGRFTCTRTVAAPKTNMRLITIAVSWTGNDGRGHTVTSQARYAKHGLNDYFYVSH